MIELTCVKNNKGQFVAFGFLYLFIKRNHMADYNIFLPITISNSGIELGYVMSLCSHDYNIAIKNHYEKMINLNSIVLIFGMYNLISIILIHPVIQFIKTG